MNYETQLAAYREMTERGLAARMDAQRADSRVIEAMRYSLLGGGKRIRAALCLAVCEACGAPADRALPAACAVEMLHAYSLIHDDLPCMDDDALRRGKPACHIAYGETVALLAGDALLTLAFETLCEMQDAAACVQTLSRAAGCLGMIRGQELDLEAETRELSLAELTELDARKTGALIRAAARMGALAAGASGAQLAAADGFAREIGVAFQIIDDILDCTSDTGTLGKPVGSDEAQSKRTYVRLAGLDGARRAANERTAAALRALDAGFSGDAGAFLRALAENLRVRVM